jgi:hypothetical protein
MIFAIIENNIVINIASGHRPLTSNWVLVPTGMSVSIGDTFDGATFYDQDGNPRLAGETVYVQGNLTALQADVESENILKDAQIKALSDRNDFLEDCIAEMAGMVYA